ncbi:MAG TPA: DUF1073 domain-containing protein [Frateuria sp.]|uniref:DUF1073 domain-containing protein n=1 Tax=Frateuria sp. TaxID=2211372 RepID=UPI002DF51A58|nr:DUF1073 domain-containing protein [Frateuria sp.]
MTARKAKTGANKRPAGKGAPKATEKKALRISPTLLASLLAQPAPTAPARELVTYQPAPGVVPADRLEATMAQDATPYGYVGGLGAFGCQNHFPGYPYLAQMAQRPEYRKMVATLAEEMTRKWICLRASGEEDKSERIQQLDAAIRRFKLREHFRQAVEHDGYFGRGQLYVEVKKPGGALASDDDAELQTLLSLSNKKLPKGSLVAFRLVEPMWTYPGLYNSTNPLAKDFYQPFSWYVMGKTVHASRMLMFISRPVPDLLKAAYSFGGLSMSQLAEPYVEHWIRTRNSVSDIVHSFSVSGLKTSLDSTLAGESGTQLINRAELFNRVRDNRGLMLLDMESEDFFQFNTPLSGLDALQAQAQEQMASVSNIPLVKLLGITPTGLNASSEGEIRVFYDYVHSQQELHREPLKRAIDLIQLSEFGEIDPDIDFMFEPLHQLSDLEQAQVRKADADTDQVLIDAGVITQEEARKRLAADPDSPYHGLEEREDLGEDGEDEVGAQPKA